MNVPLIKIEKKTNGKIELAKTIISIFCNLQNIHLSNAEATVLAYFMVYKITEQTKQLIIKSEVLSSVGSLNNAMSVLRREGLIKKNNKQDILNPNLNIELQPLMGILIKLDNK